MDIRITAKNLELTDALRAYITEKMGVLTKYDSEITLIDVEIDKNQHHRKGEVFHVRGNVTMPRRGLIHAEAMESAMYASVDVCQKELGMQLTDMRDKEKHNRPKRQAARDMKSFLSRIAFWK